MDVAFDMSALGFAIVKRRLALGWNTHRLAEKAGLPDPYVRRLERGEVGKVGAETLLKVARALAISAEDLARQAGVSFDPQPQGPVDEIYQRLANPERRALFRMGEALRDLQAEYEHIQGIAEEPAAYGDPLPSPPFPGYEPESEPEE